VKPVDSYQQLIALFQVIAIDLVLAGDNAIVVGMAASRVAPSMRAKVILWGVGGAVVLRILFAAAATQLLAIIGLTLAGGILLLWVCWKMYREIRIPRAEPAFAGHAGGLRHGEGRNLSFRAALVQIIAADVSMSLDNVLAVAGAAKGDVPVLVVGLVVAIACMALLSTYIAKLLQRFPSITWIGLAIVLYVALEMIWSGTHQVACHLLPPESCGNLASLLGALR
jgi:YjbE family integral membrane protein